MRESQRFDATCSCGWRVWVTRPLTLACSRSSMIPTFARTRSGPRASAGASLLSIAASFCCPTRTSVHSRARSCVRSRASRPATTRSGALRSPRSIPTKPCPNWSSTISTPTSCPHARQPADPRARSDRGLVAGTSRRIRSIASVSTWAATRARRARRAIVASAHARPSCARVRARCSQRRGVCQYTCDVCHTETAARCTFRGTAASVTDHVGAR